MSRDKGISPRQQQVLAFVTAQINRGSSPTIQEIAEHFGWASPNAARDHVQALINRNLLRRKPGGHRGLRLADEHDKGNPLVVVSDCDPRVVALAPGEIGSDGETFFVPSSLWPAIKAELQRHCPRASAPPAAATARMPARWVPV